MLIMLIIRKMRDKTTHDKIMKVVTTIAEERQGDYRDENIQMWNEQINAWNMSNDNFYLR